MKRKPPWLYRQWSYRKLDDPDWYLQAFKVLGETATAYAASGYEERRVYSISQVESSSIAYAIYFPQMYRLGIQDGDDLYWSDGITDITAALDAWVQEPETWANLMTTKDNTYTDHNNY